MLRLLGLRRLLRLRRLRVLESFLVGWWSEAYNGDQSTAKGVHTTEKMRHSAALHTKSF